MWFNKIKWNIKILFKWKIIEVVEKEFNWRKFEIARRSPWVRLIITDWEKFLLTKEFRYEHNGYDYRLPGGKVFDTLDEFNRVINSNENIDNYAKHAAIDECLQETWLIVKSIEPITISKAWSTIERDLHYFLIKDFEENVKWQELEDGEDIGVEWKNKDELMELCLNWFINEDRSVWIIFKYLLKK